VVRIEEFKSGSDTFTYKTIDKKEAVYNFLK
jgi:hypothetical protein